MSETHPENATRNSLDKTPADENNTAAAQAAPTSVEPVAPQNTEAAGAATGEQHALLSANVSGSEQEGAAEKASRLAEMPGGHAGYHSTGSVTGTSGGPTGPTK